LQDAVVQKNGAPCIDLSKVSSLLPLKTSREDDAQAGGELSVIVHDEEENSRRKQKQKPAEMHSAAVFKHVAVPHQKK
jgi:hypothetical protein